MTPIAVGMRRRFFLFHESFLLTQGITHAKTLEQTLADFFCPPLDRPRVQQKRNLIAQLANLTQRMHGEGFQHQDFYLCHILANPGFSDNPVLYIVDLHRVRRRQKNKQRWRIKDLAELNYSASQKFISRTDRLRFMKHYDPFLANDRLFLKRIMEKTARIRSMMRKNRKNISGAQPAGGAVTWVKSDRKRNTEPGNAQGIMPLRMCRA
jgi:exopolyphosphatase/pppGpp-phosphohydrolase